MRFMVLVPGSPESEAGEMPGTDILGAMTKYNEDLVKAGVMLAGEGLHPTSRGAKVRFNGSERTVIDGPFTEAKEIVAGYWVWECASREEAIEWLRRAPFDAGVEIELRQIFEADDFGEQLTPELREANERLREQAAQNEAHGVVGRPSCDRRRVADRVGPADRRADSHRARRRGGRGSGPGRARRRTGAVAWVRYPGQPGCLADGRRQAPGHRCAAPARHARA